MKHGNNEIIKIKCVIDMELKKEILWQNINQNQE